MAEIRQRCKVMMTLSCIASFSHRSREDIEIIRNAAFRTGSDRSTEADDREGLRERSLRVSSVGDPREQSNDFGLLFA